MVRTSILMLIALTAGCVMRHPTSTTPSPLPQAQQEPELVAPSAPGLQRVIVTLKPNFAQAQSVAIADAMASMHDMSIGWRYGTALRGFAAELPADEVEALAGGDGGDELLEGGAEGAARRRDLGDGDVGEALVELLDHVAVGGGALAGVVRPREPDQLVPDVARQWTQGGGRL
jgi:hypothetical protein